jgi:hypothetical protein
MLENCFKEASRVLKPNGLMIFTFQHAQFSTWLALGNALISSGLRAIQVFPLLGDSKAGLHKQTKTSSWDAVFVLRKNQERTEAANLIMYSDQLDRINAFHVSWIKRIKMRQGISFSEEDARNFKYACLVAGSLGFQRENIDKEAEVLSLSDLISDQSL